MATHSKDADSQGNPRQLPVEDVAIDQLRPHPRNYLAHPEDELEHILESIKTHGFYRNIVLARDNTILAGHGVVKAAQRLGYERVPAVRTDYAPDDPRALKLLVSDNEIRHLAEVDDRALSELLRELNETAEGLLGTGYDELMLANLAMVTRPADEIADFDAAAQWVGMPDYDMGPGQIQITMHFANDEDRTEFLRRLGLDTKDHERSKSIWWPERKKDDRQAIRFTDDAGGGDD